MSVLLYILTNGKLVVNNDRPFMGVNGSVQGIITQKDKLLKYEVNSEGELIPPVVTDSDTLQGHPASDFAPVDHSHTGYAPATHNHDASQIVGGVVAVERGGTGVNSIADTVYTTPRFRASALFNVDTNPTVNGVINWTYE